MSDQTKKRKSGQTALELRTQSPRTLCPLCIVMSTPLIKVTKKNMAAVFADSGSILDGMPPQVWHGTTAAEDWYRDVLTNTKKEGASDCFVTAGQPLYMEITADADCVVVPANMNFKAHGKQMIQSGAVFTMALRRLSDGWRIAAWAWAKGTPVH